ncbi:Tetracycline resistance protein [Bacillus amyloliquefaciens]|nr:Tetracycline resistance protein [Bacillus amyloliquefaciens]
MTGRLGLWNCFGTIIGFVGHSFFPVLILARLIQETGAAALGCSCTLYSEREQGESIWSDRVRRINGKGAGPAIGGMVAHYIHWSYLLLVPTATIITVPFLIKQL